MRSLTDESKSFPGAARSFRRPSLIAAAVAVVLSACHDHSEVVRLGPAAAPAETNPAPAHAPAQRTASSEEEVSPRVLRRFGPIDGTVKPEPPALIALGRMLYYEVRLSKNGNVSCNSCHPLDHYGATHTAVSTGSAGSKGTRNAPTTYNTAGHVGQFWDGRAGSLQEQAVGPIENPVEMGMKAEDAVHVLRGIPGYRDAFKRAFPAQAEPITMENVTGAVAAFERGLITPGRWDRYLRGDTAALTPREKEGVKLFANLGCVVCHTGTYLGATMFEKIGVHAPWPNQKDRGRAMVSANKADDMVFKVPSLRNVTRTAPYFHDGSVEKVEDAIRLMAHAQLGVELADDEVSAIAAWFDSLTGELPRDYIAPPPLPLASQP